MPRPEMSRGRETFWQRILSVLDGMVERLEEGECSEPLELRRVAERAGLDPGRLKAPDLISIDVVERLPAALRSRGLYVVRLGQRHTGTASFALCRASRGYTLETLGIDEVLAAPLLPVEPVALPEWLANMMGRVSTEALAFISAYILVEALARGERVYVLPSLRLGGAKFRFRPAPRAGVYAYHGQVEVDAVLGRRLVYALEAKSLRSRESRIFKYKVAFSAQALAELIGREVHPLLSIVAGGCRVVSVALLSPPARPGEPYPVAEMRPYARLELHPPSS